MSAEITPTEAKRLVTLEKTISKGEKSFIEVGNALLEIRDTKLYRENHNNFEDYCLDKWGWGRQRGYELIYAAQVVDELPENVIKKITNSGQAKALSKVPKKEREAVIRQAEKSGKVTAKSIKKFTPPSKKKSETPKEKVETDVMGFPIPEPALTAWFLTHEVQEVLNYVHEARTRFKKMRESGHVLFAKSDFQTIQGSLDQAHASIAAQKPYAVCVGCLGKEPMMKKCDQCKGIGMVSKFYWSTCVPEEIRKMREKEIERLK
jgi:hypothetical protein